MRIWIDKVSYTNLSSYLWALFTAWRLKRILRRAGVTVEQWERKLEWISKVKGD